MTSLKLCFKFLVVYTIIYTTNGHILQPCRVGDDACVSESVKAAWLQLTAGIPSAGVETLEPLFMDVIKGDLSILKFTFTNTTIKGYGTCEISDVQLDVKELTLNLEMNCPDVDMKGHYVINGRLIVLPVEGDGDYHIFAKLFHISVKAKLQISKGHDGIEHLSIKSYKLDMGSKDEIHYNFTNLFNGQKDLSGAVLRFANENWKEVSNFVQEPVIGSEIKKIVKNINKYLKTVPVNEIILQ